MAGRVSDSTLEEIRLRTDIVELIGSRVSLRRAGPDFKACCPFHREKTPSFFVSPSRRTFHCFGCGVHGDVFKYLMLSDGMTFPDAVRFLAKRAGVQIDETVDYEAAARGVLLRLHTQIALFFARCLRELKEAEPAREYLRSRKLPDDVVERFGIGYAPERKGVLLEWAKHNHFTPDNLVEGGLLQPPRPEYPGDSYWDRFRGRLMFPIRDPTGQVVGFSGRILDADAKAAKYVNSPETSIFHKGSLLYALDFARANIVKDPRREALVCEGQIDVIRCHANGFGTAVAGQGTAFTEDHVNILKRYADSVMLVYDADNAGLKAAVRTGRLFLQAGIPVRIATLPPGEDPDSLLRDKGAEAFQAILDRPESLVAYQVRMLRAKESAPDSIDAVSRISNEILETLSDCSKAVLRSVLLREAADALGVPESALESDLAAFLEKKSGQEKWRQDAPASPPSRPHAPSQSSPAVAPAAQTAAPPPRPARPRDTATREIAEMLVQAPEDPDLRQCVYEWLPSVVIGEGSPEDQIISAALRDGETGGGEAISSLAENGDEPVRALLGSLAVRASRVLGAKEVTPLEAMQDLVTRAWIDYLERTKSELGALDRLVRAQMVSNLRSHRDWATRSSLLYQEILKMAEDG